MASLAWPHPLVHWLVRREARLSEFAADRFALAQGTSRKTFAHLLGTLAELRAVTPLALPAAPVSWGLAADHAGRIVVTLEDGRALGFAE